MATHSSVLAWRIPGTAGPGGLPSMGSHRHDWSDLATAVAARWRRGQSWNWWPCVDVLFLLLGSFSFVLPSLLSTCDLTWPSELQEEQADLTTRAGLMGKVWVVSFLGTEMAGGMSDFLPKAPWRVCWGQLFLVKSWHVDLDFGYS